MPHTDPFDRQITIGLGCFLEQTRIAASADGYDVTLDLYPEGPDGPVARATFAKGGNPDPLAAHIMNRRSVKEAFANTPVSGEKAEKLRQYCEVHIDQPTVNLLIDITWQAQRLEMNIPRTMQESVEWMRFGKAEINASPDGIALGGPLLESMMLAGILSREAQSDPKSQGFKEGVKVWEQMFAATPAFVSMTTDGNTRKDQIEVGARWVRLNLTTTALGLSLHPISQAAQEYEEMKPHFNAAHDLLAQDGQTVQMLGRLGYGPNTPRAPRWHWRQSCAMADQTKGPPDTSPFLLFEVFTEIGILEQLSRALLEARLPDGIIASHFGVLNHLMRGRDGQTPLKLARAFQTPKTSMTHTLKVLEQRGLIELRSNPDDGRSKQAWITDAGRAMIAATIQDLADHYGKLAQDLDMQALGDIKPVLANLRAYLDDRREQKTENR